MVNAGRQPLVLVEVKLVGDAALRVSQVSKNGPLVDFEDLRCEVRLHTFDLRITVAIAMVALRAPGLVVMQQLPLGVAIALLSPVGVHG